MALGLGSATRMHSAFRNPMPPSSPYTTLEPAAKRRPCRRRQALAGASIRLQLDECVFVAGFKFARFARLHGRDARSKPKFSVAVAAVAVVAGVAVAGVAAATVAVATVAVAAAVVAVIVTVIGRVAVGAVGAVKGAGAQQ